MSELTHHVEVVDYSPGTGPSVRIHRAGCRCSSRREAVESTGVPGTTKDAADVAGRVARRWGLRSDDFCVMDCALFGDDGRATAGALLALLGAAATITAGLPLAHRVVELLGGVQ